MDKMLNVLDQYKNYLDYGTHQGFDYSKYFERIPLSRYHTYKKSYEIIINNNLKRVLELGTCRSFVNGDIYGCNSNDIRYWDKTKIENWDWYAGIFSVVTSRCLLHKNINITTLDIELQHINRCKIMTEDYKDNFNYVVSNSLDYLSKLPENSYDLIYIDTGDMTPIEATANLQLEECKIIKERKILNNNGILLIDDVKNLTPTLFGDNSLMGKSKYSINYLINNGFEIIMDEYQVILKNNN
jgi:hypothetical protein